MNKENRKLIKTAIKGFNNAKLVDFSENYATFICGCESICAIVEISFNYKDIKKTYLTPAKLKIMSEYAKINSENYHDKGYKKYRFARHGVKYGL